ncbi:MAG: T9SS type A sorting domain-containing protein [Ignavibacteriae bacterium]|nr:T9SS type A sorting domain-containing protein [Ignavibacteriota bacterium]
MKNNSLYILTFFVSTSIIATFFLNEENKKDYVFNKRIKIKLSRMEKLQSIKDRNEYMFQLMRDPKTNSIPENIRAKEIEYAKTLPKKISNELLKTNREGFDWEEIGPKDVGGRTRALAIDVTNSNRVLAGGVSGGIWETTTQGASWEFLSSSNSLLSVTSIAQDTRTGHTDTWYFSAGEFDGNSASETGASFRGNGIFKSTDNGITWNILSNTLSSITSWDSRYDYISRIVVNPSTGSVFIACNGYGISKSNDGGNSFSTMLGSINDHRYCDIVVAGDGTLVASISESGYNDSPVNSPGIYISVNDGDSWDDITPNDFPSTHERTVIAISESNTNIVYVLTNTGQYNGEDEIVKLFKIDNSTGTSFDLSANLPTFSSFRGSFTAQSNYDLTIAVKPDDENFVVLGSVSLFRSTDGVSTKLDDSKIDWIGGYSSDGSGQYPSQHPDQHILVFDKNSPNTLWSGHDGGISFTSNITYVDYDTFFPWMDKNRGYNVTQFYTVAISKEANDNRLMGGTQDNGTPYFKFIVNSPSNSEDISSGDGSFAYFGTSKAYVSSQNGTVVRISYDALGNPQSPFTTGIGWSDVYPINATDQIFISPFSIDPNDEKIMYYPAGKSLWRNNNIESIPNYVQGGTEDGWSELTNITIHSGYFISSINVSKSNPNHLLYIAASNNSDTPKIYKLENANSSTDGEVDVSIPNAPSGARIVDIAINPENGNEILVVMSNYNIVGLFHSLNGGLNYTEIEGNLLGNQTTPGPSLRSATILPYNGDTYYFIGTSTGLYSTINLSEDATIWEQESSEGLGNVLVQQLTSRTSDNVVVAATHGRGMFKGKPNGIVNIREDEVIIPNEFILEQNYPNPFNPETIIKYTVPKNENSKILKVKLKIYDVLGSEISTIVNESKSSGRYETRFNGSGLTSGIYYYTLSVGQFSDTKKMILLK